MAPRVSIRDRHCPRRRMSMTAGAPDDPEDRANGPQAPRGPDLVALDTSEEETEAELQVATPVVSRA